MSPDCPIFVISLAETPRRSECWRILNGLGLDFSFVDAVDGRCLNATQRACVYDGDRNRSQFKRALSAPEIGCYLSHLSVWERIATAAPQAALVLEDDFAVDGDLPAFLQGIQAFDLTDVMIKLDGPLGWRRRLHKTVAARVGATEIREFKVVTPYTMGYILGRRAAKRLVNARGRFFRPVDIDLKFTWEHAVHVLATEPALVHENTCGGISSINGSREMLKPRNPLLRFTRNLLYQTRFQIGRLQHDLEHQPFKLRRRDGVIRDREERA